MHDGKHRQGFVSLSMLFLCPYVRLCLFNSLFSTELFRFFLTCMHKICIFADTNQINGLMKYALVTGASSGMGLQFALQLADKGYGIILVSNRPDENRQAAELIRQRAGVDTRIVDADLTAADAAQKLYDQVHSWQLEVEVLISNAGMLLFSTLTRTSVQALDKILSLHCTTPVKLIRLFGQDMQERRKGYILITSSSSAWMQYPTISHYGATKAFLKNFSRAIWYEFRRYNVGVTAFFPGAVDTPLYNLEPSKRKLFRSLGMMMSPEKAVSLGLKAMFHRRYRCIPGLFTKISVAICAVAPAWLFLPILKIPYIKRLFESV